MNNKTSMGQSFAFAWDGIVQGLRRERNFKIHLAAAAEVTAFAFWLHISRMEWVWLCMVIFSVLTAELVNTAIEKTVDLMVDHYHPLAEIAKNAAAGAVLLSAVNAVIIGVLIFYPYLFNR